LQRRKRRRRRRRRRNIQLACEKRWHNFIGQYENAMKYPFTPTRIVKVSDSMECW
jgi:hypothetical protein